MDDNLEIHKIMGQMQGKIDCNNEILSFLKEKINSIDDDIKANSEVIYRIRQIQDKHKLILMTIGTVLSGVFCELIIRMLQ